MHTSNDELLCNILTMHADVPIFEYHRTKSKQSVHVTQLNSDGKAHGWGVDRVLSNGNRFYVGAYRSGQRHGYGML